MRGVRVRVRVASFSSFFSMLFLLSGVLPVSPRKAEATRALSPAAFTTTRCSTDVPKRIPPSGTGDPNCNIFTSSTLNVTGLVGHITDINVRLYVTHTFDGDLEGILVSPDGSIVVPLMWNDGGGGDNFGSTCNPQPDCVFDDQAAVSIDSASAPFVGSFRPSSHVSANHLSDLNGLSPNGAWMLAICDHVAVDFGFLQCWCLDITTDCSAGLCAACTAAQGTQDPVGTLNLLYRFRDDVLAQSPRGQQYTRMFYETSPEVVRIMLYNSALLSQTRGLLERYKPVVGSMVDRRVALGRLSDLKQINDLMQAYAAKGSRTLQSPIESLRRDLRDPRVYKEFNVNITTNRSSAASLVFQTRDGPGEPKAGVPASGGLVLTDYGNDQLKVLLGNGDGSFTKGQIVPVGHGPSAIAIGDFNNDGRTDVVTVNELSHDLSILMGNGDGTFGRPRSIPAGSQPSAVVAGDFNGDRRLDLIVADARDNDLRVLKGRGDGAFEGGQSIAIGNGPTGLAAGDFNGDGRLDLVVSNFASNEVVLITGRGDGTFSRSASYTAADGEIGVTAADFDGDGRPEIAVANFTSNDLTILKVGERGLSVLRRLPVGEGPITLVPGEFVPGRLGLAAANLMSGEISIWPTLDVAGSNKYQRYVVTAAPASITLGDFNRDGRLDLAILDEDGVTLRVLLNQGDGTFRLAR